MRSTSLRAEPIYEHPSPFSFIYNPPPLAGVDTHYRGPYIAYGVKAACFTPIQTCPSEQGRHADSCVIIDWRDHVRVRKTGEKSIRFPE